MALLHRGLMVLATAGALAIPGLGPNDKGKAPAGGDRTVIGADSMALSPESIEFYLDSDTQAWIRPGLNVTIGAVTNFAPGQKPSVEVTVLDDLKQPLDRLGGTTPGVISLRFVADTWSAENRVYTNLITASGNPSRDSAGTWVDLGSGKYKYTFALALKASGWDPASPATLAVVGSRNLTDIIGKNYYVNQWLDFVPSTGADATGKVWAATSNTMCTNCHDPLTFTGSNWPHGGNYRSIRTCVLCHNKSNMVGQNTSGLELAQFNGQVFFHQIHAGLNPDVAPDITLPRALNHCAGCHDPKAASGSTWNMHPGQKPCGACHVTVDFANHPGPGEVQVDDSKCADCHVPDSGKEWDISVVGAHKEQYLSNQLLGLKATIVSVSNVKAGESPTIVMKVVDRTGAALDPSKFRTFAPVFSAPTADYGAGTWLPVPPSTTTPLGNFREDARTLGTYDPVAGTFTYTFLGKIPADITGTVAFCVDTQRDIKLLKADGSVKNAAFREPAGNPIYYASLDETVPAVARRTSVTIAQCLKCHEHFNVHGGRRQETQECVMCHNPSLNNASPNGVESIDFKRLVHRIHTGEGLTQSYRVGNTWSPNDVTYPGDRRACVTCHTTTGYYPSTDPARRDTVTATDYFTPQGPTTTACLGCHDAKAYAAHAYLNTAPFGEACQTCHGAGNEWGADKVHAR